MRAAAACALALAALAAGCGDDEEEPADREPAGTAATATQTTPAETTDDAPPETDDPVPGPPAEDTPADPSDPEAEEPVRSEAVFTGRRGRISPRRIAVPPYIAVTVVLRRGDGRDYSIVIEGRRMSVGQDTEEAFLELDGLQPQDRYTGTAGGQALVIAATAEPGP